jgi:phosphoglucosamine mutase
MLGGESSGHIICLDQTSTGDGLVSSLQVLAAMMDTDFSLYELKSGMKKYPQCLVNVKVKSQFDLFSNDLIKHAVQDAETELNGSGRVLLRFSGTEPLIRVMVEGVDGSLVDTLAHQLATVVTETAA